MAIFKISNYISKFKPIAQRHAAAQNPVTLYICYPERELSALTPLLRLIWMSLLDDMIAIYDKQQGKDCAEIYAPLDEAGVTNIPDMPRFVSTANGRGIFFGMFIQSLSQLKARYGSYGATTILDNMESQLFYRQSSLETAEHLRHKLDNPKEWEMTARAIQELPDDEVIGFHRNLKPFRARRMDWRHFPILQQRAAIPAPAILV